MARFWPPAHNFSPPRKMRLPSSMRNSQRESPTSNTKIRIKGVTVANCPLDLQKRRHCGLRYNSGFGLLVAICYYRHFRDWLKRFRHPVPDFSYTCAKCWQIFRVANRNKYVYKSEFQGFSTRLQKAAVTMRQQLRPASLAA